MEKCRFTFHNSSPFSSFLIRLIISDIRELHHQWHPVRVNQIVPEVLRMHDSPDKIIHLQKSKASLKYFRCRFKPKTDSYIDMVVAKVYLRIASVNELRTLALVVRARGFCNTNVVPAINCFQAPSKMAFSINIPKITDRNTKIKTLTSFAILTQLQVLHLSRLRRNQ